MIELRDIRKSYRMGDVDVHALRGVSLRIEDGEFVAIMGPSGSGKSTLMHILGLLDKPGAGEYRLDGRVVSGLSDAELAAARGRTIGFVFQQFNLLPRMSALENVGLPLIYTVVESPASPRALLEGVGLGDRLHHAPNALSGGQQQRAAIARALVASPRILMADEPTGNLDSSSAREILALLSGLNAAGLTLIMVTHDAEVAASARRVIRLRDGLVVSDVRQAPQALAGSTPMAAVASMEASKAGAGLGRGGGGWRRGKEALAMVRQARRALMANKTRTLLSMLGVLIGVAAVIAMLALGAGAQAAIQERIAAMGANLLVIRPGTVSRGGVSLAAGSVSRLRVEDAEAIPLNMPDVVLVAPVVRGGVQVVADGRNWETQAVGTTAPYAALHSSPPLWGRFLNAEDVRQRARVVVLGATVARELYDGSNPVGKVLRINRAAFEVVGVLPETGASMRWDPNDMVLVPVTTAMRRMFGEDYLHSIEVQVRDGADTDALQVALERFMCERYRIDPKDEEAYRVRNMADIQNAIKETSNTMAMLLAGIGLISLLVGGIGIMNIMLVSVTERTREIGVRKAIGARRGDILAQFLVEAVFVSGFGGVLGILLGWGAAIAMSHFADWSVLVAPGTVLLAFGFATLVGVIFGFWPALKASRLNPIDALRSE